MAHHAAPFEAIRGRTLPKVRKPLVLCVDDNEAVLEILFTMLTDHGFRVQCETDPLRACRWIQSMAVDAVVVDYNMPALNGSELASLIRRDNPEIPVLMFSGALDPPEALDAVWMFVSKTRGVMALIEALNSKLVESYR